MMWCQVFNPILGYIDSCWADWQGNVIVFSGIQPGMKHGVKGRIRDSLPS